MELSSLSNLDLSGIPERQLGEDEIIGLFVVRRPEPTEDPDLGELGVATRTYIHALADQYGVPLSAVHYASTVTDTENYAGTGEDITDDGEVDPGDEG